jgi:hypothetical protein
MQAAKLDQILAHWRAELDAGYAKFDALSGKSPEAQTTGQHKAPAGQASIPAKAPPITPQPSPHRMDAPDAKFGPMVAQARAELDAGSAKLDAFLAGKSPKAQTTGPQKPPTGEAPIPAKAPPITKQLQPVPPMTATPGGANPAALSPGVSNAINSSQAGKTEGKMANADMTNQMADANNETIKSQFTMGLLKMVADMSKAIVNMFKSLGSYATQIFDGR